jgi:hypothetical protein
MSGDPNPYAPPTAVDDGKPAIRQWQLDVSSILARNRALLPKVDLDTGEHGMPMKPVHLATPSKSPMATVASGLITGVIVFCAAIFNSHPVIIFAAVITMIIGWRLVALRTGSDGKMIAWAFMGETRANGLNRRRRIRARVFFGCVLGYLWIVITDFTIDSPLPLVAFLIGVFGCAIWGIIDRPKVRATTVDGEWLRLAPIHPQAIEFLRVEQDRISTVQNTGRKRLVRTSWLHRYPLRLLIGQTRNPLLLLRIILMKTLRSKLLVRESYHYSEAEKRQPYELCPALQDGLNSWLENHSNWHIIEAEHLPCPAGDLTVESVTFASPGFEHTLTINRAWMEQAADRAENHHHFMTRFADGSAIRTHDRHFLDLHIPGITERRTSGNPDAVYQNHLAALNGRIPAAPENLAALLAHIAAFKETFDKALTAAGYQSEARETGGS